MSLNRYRNGKGKSILFNYNSKGNAADNANANPAVGMNPALAFELFDGLVVFPTVPFVDTVVFPGRVMLVFLAENVSSSMVLSTELVVPEMSLVVSEA
jgi:hypothetical protein